MNKKILLFIFLGCILVGLIVGLYMWNKPPETVDHKKGIEITSLKLSSDFEQNEQNANTLYLNKVIQVSGKVVEIDKNQDGKTVILLDSANPLSGVQCTMKSMDVKYNVGDSTSIKGFCDGYTTVVILTGCIKVQ